MGEVVCLANANLHQPSQAMFSHLPVFVILPRLRTVLQRTGRLQQPFLRLQPDDTFCAVSGLDALGVQPASSAGTGVEDEVLQRLLGTACPPE